MSGLNFYNKNGIEIENDENNVAEKIKRILLTDRGERVGDLEFGSSLRKYLFMPEMSIPDVIKEIKSSVDRCDPSIEILDCYIKNYDRESEILTIGLTARKKSNNKIIETSMNI